MENQNKRLLSFQYDSLYQNGGASRVLRRLYQGQEDRITSLCVKTNNTPVRTGDIKEVFVPVFPFLRPWMRWHIRGFVIWLRNKVFHTVMIKKLRKGASAIDCDIIHTVNHGPYSTALCDSSFAGKALWVSFHDHYSTCSSFEDTGKLWNAAERRLMISRELGNEYQRVFGDKPFEVITDGVATEEISQPEPVAGKSPVTIYFAGLLHIDYLPLFNVLADSLEVLAWQAIPVKLILRGTSSVGFLNNRSFEVEYKQGFVTDEEVKKELDAADILYLPIKFNLPAFYLYSLSTKMVSYLGGCGTILYHGPKDSAACNFLRSNQGAICCTTLEVNDLANAVKECLQTDATFSANAKKMAFDHFLLSTLQNRFWQIAK